MKRSVVGMACWLTFLVGTLWLLVQLGDGGLGTPPIGAGVHGFEEWLRARDAATLTMASIRVAAIGASGYLIGVTVAGAVARLTGRGLIVAAVDRITVPAMRRALSGVTLLALATGPVAAAHPVAAVAAAAAPADPPRIVPLDPAQPPTATSATWTVQRGDNFWDIASELLHGAWRRAPTDAEIIPYWKRLIAENRARLRDPGNPDLIYPGQVFSVPDVGAPPPRSPASGPRA